MGFKGSQETFTIVFRFCKGLQGCAWEKTGMNGVKREKGGVQRVENGLQRC